MKEKLEELTKKLVVIVLAILILSLIYWILGIIIVKIFDLDINLTYVKAIGLVVIMCFIRGIVNFFIEGIDINEVIMSIEKESMLNKNYKFAITYKNNSIIDGTLTAINLQQAKEIILNDKCTLVNNGKKLVYYNSDEIQFCEIEEID